MKLALYICIYIYIYMIKPRFEQNKLFEFLIETKLVSQYGGHVTRNFSYYVDIESFESYICSPQKHFFREGHG